MLRQGRLRWQRVEVVYEEGLHVLDEAEVFLNLGNKINIYKMTKDKVFILQEREERHGG